MASPHFTLTVDDEIELVHVMSSDAEIMHPLIMQHRETLQEWLPWAAKQTDAESENFLKRAESNYLDKKIPTFKIVYKGEPCGIIGLNHINEDHNYTSIGYWMIPPFEGKGIMTRACKRLIQYAFEERDMNKVEINVNPDNKKSLAIPKRLGFIEEGTLRQRELLANGEYGSLTHFGMLSSEWKNLEQ